MPKGQMVCGALAGGWLKTSKAYRQAHRLFATQMALPTVICRSQQGTIVEFWGIEYRQI
ncbi:MAG: hypothetical protein ACLR56_15625 [Oscillospiraceae bacterium]